MLSFSIALKRAIAALVLSGLVGCATTPNLFFPTVPAQKAADSVLDDIFAGAEPDKPKPSVATK